MAIDLLGGAAAGVALSELWRKIEEAKNHVKDFKRQLVRLQDTLELLDPTVQGIITLSTQLNDHEGTVARLMSIIEDGKKLISKCYGVSQWNFLKKKYHRKRLMELDRELTRFNIHNMPLRICQQIMLGRLEQSSLLSQISDQIESLSAQIESLRPSDAGDAAGGGGPIHFRPLMPPPLPNRAPTTLVPFPPPNNRAPSIDTLGLGSVASLPSIKIESNEADPGEDVERLRSLLEEREKLVRDSSNIGCWNLVKKWKWKWQCRKKMVELDNKLLRFHCLYLQDRLAKNRDDYSKMKYHESFEPSAHYDQIESNEVDPGEDAERLSLLEEREKLVCDSSDTGCWNLVKKWKWQCQKRMVELDNKLLRFHCLYLQARLAKNRDDYS